MENIYFGIQNLLSNVEFILINTTEKKNIRKTKKYKESSVKNQNQNWFSKTCNDN